MRKWFNPESWWSRYTFYVLIFMLFMDMAIFLTTGNVTVFTPAIVALFLLWTYIMWPTLTKRWKGRKDKSGGPNPDNDKHSAFDGPDDDTAFVADIQFAGYNDAGGMYPYHFRIIISDHEGKAVRTSSDVGYSYENGLKDATQKASDIIDGLVRQRKAERLGKPTTRLRFDENGNMIK